MRRTVPLILAALLAIGLVSPVAAGKPDRFPQEPIEQLFVGACGFDVALADYFARGHFWSFQPDKLGDTRIKSNGGFRSILWNVDHPEIRVDVEFFGTLNYTVRADGTIELKQTGEALWWFTDAADAAQYGLDPGIYIIRGRVDAVLDENFVAHEPPTKFNVTVRDLCAELAP